MISSEQVKYQFESIFQTIPIIPLFLERIQENQILPAERHSMFLLLIDVRTHNLKRVDWRQPGYEYGCHREGLHIHRCTSIAHKDSTTSTLPSWSLGNNAGKQGKTYS